MPSICILRKAQQQTRFSNHCRQQPFHPSIRRGLIINGVPGSVAPGISLTHRNSYSIRVPKGAMPLVSTVFGNSPAPQIRNEPKSLYQSPSGAHGEALTHSCNRCRSWREIRRSSTRARMCSQTGLGRLEKRIFRNGVLPENCPNQVLPRFAFARGIGLRHEPLIGRTEIRARCRLRLHSALRKHDQCPAHREMLLPGHTLDLNCQLRRNGDALANGCCLSSSWR